MDLADTQVGQILIPVEDLERATAFYRDTLGITFLFSFAGHAASPPEFRSRGESPTRTRAGSTW